MFVAEDALVALPALCAPRCGAAPRHRQLLIYLQTATDLFDRPYRLLHIAPERALSRRFSTLPLVTYVSGDLSDSAMLRFDVTKLPFDDGSFDAVICLHVLEHVEDDLSALREFRRVLRHKGRQCCRYRSAETPPLRIQ